MRKHKPELPLLKEYAAFIQKNFLKEFIREVQINYKQLDVPLLKLFAHLSEEELRQLTMKSLNEFLQQFADGKAIEAAESMIRTWKANKLPGISREVVKDSDIVLVNNARKTALLKFLNEFIPATRDAYPLLKEIEDYYTFHMELALQALADINQEEVIQRESRLKEVQTIAKVGNWEYNTVTKEVKWSDELYKIYNIDPSETLFVDDVIQFILQEDFIKVQQAVRTAAQSGGTYTIEYRIKRLDGEIKTLLENGYSEKNAENQLIYRGTAQDITTLKKIENDLRENEKNFRLLAENSTDIISKHASDSTILYISPSSLPVTGYTPEELTGKKAYDFYHPEDLSDMEKKYQHVIDTPDSTIVSFRFRKKDGTYIWLESIGKTIRDENGNPLEIIATNRNITDRKEAELKLKKNEALLSGVLNSSISGTQLFKSVRDAEGNIIDFEWLLVNDSILRLWGMTRDQIIGKKLLSLFPGVKTNGVFDNYVQAAEGETLTFKQYYNSEGFSHWVQVVAMKYEDGFLLSTDDITAQIKAEEELKKSNLDLEEKVKIRTAQLEKQKEDIYSVLMQAPAMIAIVRGSDFVYELANPLYLKVLGKTKDIIGKSLLEIFPEIKGQPIHGILDNVYKTGQRFIGNEVLIPLDINNDGFTENIYFNFVYEPLRNAEGKVDGLLTHAVEVTSQVQSRMKLQESEDRFRSMADNIPNLAWMAEADGYIFWYNKRWYEYTGTTPEQMEGWGWQSVHDPNELSRVMEGWAQSLKTGNFFEMVFPLKGADQVFRPFLTRVSPIKDSEGKIIRWFGTNTDITGQVKAEETLEKKNKELIRINNDLDNFIYTASHDLKSPVSNLEGLLNMVSDESEGLITEAGKAILPMVGQSLTRLKTVMKELTEIAKIQKDVEIEQELISLDELYQEVLLSYETEINNYKGKVISDFSKAPQIKFSRRNLRSIFFNLISNALKYSDPAKEGLILVRTEKQDNYLVLIISDNGLGIPDNQKEKVFTMFRRFHTHVEGSGVGLYIVKRIMENAGGKIELESQEGKGTSFKLFFKEWQASSQR